MSPDILGQDSTASKKNADTSSLLHLFKKGQFEGHFRLYYMATNNQEPLTDYYALAFGGGIKYQTKSFKGFQLGIGGFFIWNLASSDLTKPDSITGIMNRYEIGQFDIEHPANKRDMQRLEDFFILYNYKKSFIKFGKQVIKTPFINPQDGRMRPNGEQGFWVNFNELKKTKIELGWLSQISPRGTMRWFRGASSVGIYPAGLTISGEKSDYKNNLDSKGIAIAGINYRPNKNISLQVWDHWVENIFNTLLLQGDADWKIEKKKKFSAGAQYIHQQAVHEGGNSNVDKTYFDPSQKVNIYCTRIGYQANETFIRLNYTRITNDGRFLFPREWGREPLFTFISRERNEGLGDVQAVSVNLLQSFLKEKMNTDISAGYYKTADVTDSRLNKYGMPSYYQLNLDVKYSFDGWMKGLNAELLYVYKKQDGNSYNNLKYVINKVNMHQMNVILNYIF
jgi:hypothetical protein